MATTSTVDGSAPSRQLEEETDRVLAGRTLIVASNRGPVTFSYEDDGTFSARKGSGGVVTAVSAIAQAFGFTHWNSAAS